jgi:hypothetical protein
MNDKIDENWSAEGMLFKNRIFLSKSIIRTLHLNENSTVVG